jgi:non-heme chloroperoxidase
LKDLDSAPPPDNQPRPNLRPAAMAILEGEQKFTAIHAPVLLIYAAPHSGYPPVKDPAMRVSAEARDEANADAQTKAFKIAVSQARVVMLPHANHYVFQSNEADVLREIDAFIAGLK